MLWVKKAFRWVASQFDVFWEPQADGTQKFYCRWLWPFLVMAFCWFLVALPSLWDKTTAYFSVAPLPPAAPVLAEAPEPTAEPEQSKKEKLQSPPVTSIEILSNKGGKALDVLVDQRIKDFLAYVDEPTRQEYGAVTYDSDGTALKIWLNDIQGLPFLDNTGLISIKFLKKDEDKCTYEVVRSPLARTSRATRDINRLVTLCARHYYEDGLKENQFAFEASADVEKDEKGKPPLKQIFTVLRKDTKKKEGGTIVTRRD